MPRGKFAIDRVGQVFGRWTVLSQSNRKTKNGGYYLVCKCECGTEREVATSQLTNGKSVSCGCYARECWSKNAFKHGRSKKGSVGYKEYAREKYDLHKYGLTKEAKQELIKNQNNCCYICEYKFGQKKGDMKVDHCHSSGQVRGLLCDLCNRGLGYFKDDIQSLENAIKYLAR